MEKNNKALLIVAIVIVVVLGIFILYNQWPFLTGKKIVLATQPVDPFDPFKGQYMQIRYDISRPSPVEKFENGDTIYVALKVDEMGIWRELNATHHMPTSGDFIRGTVKSQSGSGLWVEYGIEQYFFEKNAEVPTTNVTVEVVVSNTGQAKIVQLLQHGKPAEITYKPMTLTS